MFARLLVALACTLTFGASTAQAHFVWVVCPAANDDTAQIHPNVCFSEMPQPGEPHLIGKIGHTKAWVRSAAGESTELPLVKSNDEKAPALVGACPKQPAASIEAACDYGVYERGPGVLLQYYAKCLLGDWAANPALARAERLALDIVPRVADGKLQVQVLYKGNPAANSEVVLVNGAGEEQELKTDDAGRVALPAATGRLAVRAAHLEPERGGQRDGKTYKQTWHYATLTFEAPQAASAAAQSPAAQALARARAARSVWERFPGFSADLDVYAPSGNAKAKMTIDGEGNVKLDMPPSPLTDWVQQQLDTLVQHRMPAGEVAEGEVRYADADEANPLGRKIDLGDGDQDSVYRIKDDVITEVNRSAGPMRFTISVLETLRNAEDKYLPRSFTMNFFDAATGDLKISLGYFNDWQRVGGFDLPRTILETSAKKGGTGVRQIVFANCKLLEPKAGGKQAAAR